MIYKEWKPIFKKLSNDLDLSFDKDFDAAKILEDILRNKKLISPKKLEELISNQVVFVFGTGPSLEDSISKFRDVFTNKIKIAADGATSALLENGILPDIIVTDLDGEISYQINANSKGSIAIIHAHGDNIDNIEKFVPKFKGDIIGTIQTNPSNYKNIYNFGGFTDGDRAVFLADHFNAKKIKLIGFDFDGTIGKYSFSKNKDKKLKLQKLQWCKLLIDMLNKTDKIEFL
jgi:uncharacterized Rossmann fold enzyme